MAVANGTKTSLGAIKLTDKEQQLLKAFQLMPENGQAHMVGFLEILKALPKNERTTVRMLQIAVDLAPDFGFGEEQIDNLNALLGDALNREVANG